MGSVLYKEAGSKGGVGSMELMLLVAWLEVLHSDHDLTEKSLDPADLS